jgi:hypothetical protein
MAGINLHKTLETQVSWKYTVPGISLTAGIVNKHLLNLKDNPDAADNAIIPAKYYTVSFLELCNPSVSVSDSDDIEIPDNSRALNLELDLDSKFKRGYYRIHLILKDKDKKPIDVYDFYGVVDKQVSPVTDNYMTLESVRVQLGDLAISDNKLLESLEVSTGDIASGVERAIQQWNNRAPFTSKYTGSTFPYPELLRCGTIYFILQSLWTQLERNRMQYQSGGLTVDLEKRADAFANLMQQYQVNWVGGMGRVKNEEDLMNFSGSYYYQ